MRLSPHSITRIFVVGSLLLGWGIAPATAGDFAVLNNDDAGDGSLRQALINADGAPDADTITFELAGAGPHVIELNSELPFVRTGLTLLNDRSRDEAVTVRRSTAAGTPDFGIFRIASDKPVLIAGLTISRGKAVNFSGGGGGGGISSLRTALTLRNCTVSGNSAQLGGGIVNAEGRLNLRNCTVSGNSAASGGGIYNAASDGIESAVGSISLHNCTLSNNTASAGPGGGIYNEARATLNGDGGSAVISLHNCTLSGNKANGGEGGAMSNYSYGGGAEASVSLTNCTLSGNTTDSTVSSGNIYNMRGTVEILNTILKPGGGGNITSLNGTFTSLGHNLSSDAAGGGAGTGPGGYLDDPSDIRNTNPKLGPLQDNGSPTPTHALLAGSPAIHAGDDAVLTAPYNLTKDQRGLPRRIGTHVDIGAFEFDLPQTGSSLVVTTTHEHNDGACSTLDCTLLEAIKAANANADASIINFKSGLTGTILNTLEAEGFNIFGPLIINGPGARLLTLSGDIINRLFNIKSGANATISGLTMTKGNSRNLTNPSGGAVYNAGTLTLRNCSLLDNNGGSGGALANIGQATLTGCTFAGNVSTGHGGAIRNASDTAISATVIITNCTLHDNIAPSSGAITSSGTPALPASVTITNCTISGNRGTAPTAYGGGLNNWHDNTFTVRNTIIAGNSAPNGPNVWGVVDSDGNNLIGIPAGSSGWLINPEDPPPARSGTRASGYDFLNVDPLLDTAGLKNNGGPTNTIALQSGSPAINRGNDALAPNADQRGRPRQFASDVGAFEVGPINVRPDALIHTAEETVYAGDNIYNLDGISQTKTIGVQAGSTAIYVVKIQNDGKVLDTIKVAGLAGGSGWQVQYFEAATNRNITTEVTSSGWWIPDLPVGGSRTLRLKVTPAATGAGGSLKIVLVTATSLANTTKKDVVKARTTAASSPAPG